MSLLSAIPKITTKDIIFDHIVCYMDLDAFFAAVEMRENPNLRGKPVIVGGNPETLSGVVATCNYEAREYGIHSGMPVSKAVELCPHVRFSSRAYPLYTVVSNKVMTILRRYSSKVCIAGIDEAYFDISDVVKDYNEARILAYELKDDIYANEQLSCSIGIAPNIVLAKIASGVDKPNGLKILRPGEIKNFLAPRDITIIPGVGKKLGQEFNKMGIYTCGDLAQASFSQLFHKFGGLVINLWKLVNGYNTDNLKERFIPYDRKSIGEEKTFYYPPVSWAEVWDEIYRIVRNIQERLNEEKAQFKTITLKIRLRNFETFTRSRSLSAFSNSGKHIVQVVKSLLKEFVHFPPSNLRLIGVKINQLRKTPNTQTKLTSFFA
ncbi:MAG: DNA polymerase IV [Candidatus Heimdallarchaeaceae archaeon]